jgi:hypothetical protein
MVHHAAAIFAATSRAAVVQVAMAYVLSARMAHHRQSMVSNTKPRVTARVKGGYVGDCLR